MRVLLAGGGTAGHINPALAIADKIRKEHPDAVFLFVGAKGKMEEKLVPAAGYNIETLKIQGFRRRITLKNIGRNTAAAFYAATAGRRCGEIIRNFRPDIAIGTGGYVCGPLLRRAAKMGIPVLLHESNAFPGVTVKLLASSAAAVMIASEEARKHLPDGANVIVTGNPLRQGFLNTDRECSRRGLGLDIRPMVLSFGGSLGADRLNEAMAEVLARSIKDGRLQHIHATGAAGWDKMNRRLRELGVAENADGITLRRYIDDMPRCMAAADLVISRCGAMTLSELPAAGLPSILIPSPNVAENHQYHNAMALVNKGAAVCIEEKNLTSDTLWHELTQTVYDAEVLQKMSQNAHTAAITDADDRIYKVIQETLSPLK